LKEEPLLIHLAALRVFLVRSVLALLVTVGAAAFFAKPLFRLFSAPLERALPKDAHFIATSPMEAWMVYFKISLLTGVFAAAPFIFWQLWKFLSPALYDKEKTIGIAFTLLSSICFIGGAVFAYYAVFPFCFAYFTSILEGTTIALMPRMDSYFTFAAQMVIAFGFIFELPLLVFFLAAWEIVSFASLRAFRKYFIVIAAILTPPDGISQLVMAVPLLLLYEMGIGIAWLYKRSAKQSDH